VDREEKWEQVKRQQQLNCLCLCLQAESGYFECFGWYGRNQKELTMNELRHKLIDNFEYFNMSELFLN